MSVLIKGMEMPGNCAGCFMRFSGCEQRIYQEYRPKGCPLVEVPTPHGRLIDADELEIRVKLMNWCMKHYPDKFMDEVVHAPTTIEAEE